MLQNVTAKFTLFYGNQIQNKGEERIVGHIDSNKYIIYGGGFMRLST